MKLQLPLASGSSEIPHRALLFLRLGIAFLGSLGAVGWPDGLGLEWLSAQASAQEVPDPELPDDDVTDADIPSTADIFYVRPDGNDGDTGTSSSEAFQTISAATLYAPAGSIIYVGGGVYTDNAKLLDLDAPASTPTRIVADTTGAHTGVGGDVVIGPGGSLSVMTCENVRISGFIFQGPTDRCFVWRQSTGGEVEDCTFVAGTKAVKIRSGDIAFTDCVVRDFAGDGIEVFGTAELSLLDCEINTCGSTGLKINEYASVSIDGSTLDGNAGNGLTVDAITSSDDAPVETGYQILIDTRELLNAAYGSATEKGNEQISKAIQKLNEALDPKYWHDAWHPHSNDTKEAARDMGLDAEFGDKVFTKGKDAMNELKDFFDPSKDAELGNYGLVKANVAQANSAILYANEKMAMLAIEEAIIGNGDPNKIKDAHKHIKKVNKEMDKGHWHHAAGKYKDVWKKALEAGGTAQGTLGIGTDNDIPSSPVGVSLTVSNSTFSGNSYGIRASTEGTVVLDTCTLSGNTWGLYANQNTSLQVTNSTFTGSTQWGAAVTPKTAGGLSVIFDACTFHSNAGGLSLVSAIDGQVSLRSGTLIRDNTNSGLHFENCNLTLNDQAGGTAWRTLRNGYGISGNASTLTLSSISIEESSLYGVYCEGSGVSLDNCTVTGVGGVYADAANNNLTVESTRFDASSAGGWGVVRYGGDLEVKNCVVNGFDVGVYLSTAFSGDQAAVNNSTLVNLATYGVYLANGDATVKNTVLVGGSGASGLTQVSGQLTHSHNLLDGFGTPFSGTTADPSELLENPQFVDAANGDFHLAKGSPAINSGVDLTASGVTIDMSGNARPSHKVFEIGAYEYMQSGGSLRVLRWKES